MRYIMKVHVTSRVDGLYQSYSEVDEQGREVRKVGYFEDGRAGRVSASISGDPLTLDEGQMAVPTESFSTPEGPVEVIPDWHFESVWNKASGGVMPFIRE